MTAPISCYVACRAHYLSTVAFGYGRLRRLSGGSGCRVVHSRYFRVALGYPLARRGACLEIPLRTRSVRRDQRNGLMRRIDHLHLEFRFAGSRMLRDLLRQPGIKVGRRHVAQ